MIYNTQQDVLSALRAAAKGTARAEILSHNENRLLVLNSGAGLTLYAGELRDGKSLKDRLSGINLMVLRRLDAKAGTPDGLGTFGGLAERTNPFEFYQMSVSERFELVGKKDDVILSEWQPVLTKEMSIIRRNNVAREAKEELADLGLTDINIDMSGLELISLDGVKDDNYITNIWNGYGAVYAVNPYCHLLKTNDDFIDYLMERSQRTVLKENSEAQAIEKHPLFDMLSRFGKQGGAYISEDGRDMQNDYRYPHEWLMSWVIAAKVLSYNEDDMIRLAAEVQKSAGHLVDFNFVATRMKVGLDSVDRILNIPENTIEKMQATMQSIYNGKLGDNIKAPGRMI